MDRRGFLKVALGVAGAAAALATLPAEAMPRMAPVPETGPKPGEAPAAAIATPEDIAEAKVENVYWRRRWGYRRWGYRRWGYRRWGYRRWGYRPWRWRRRYWRRRYWGWGWRRRYWW